MNLILKKLTAKHGASIMMALLFLLVAVMVSTVVISAALTAAKSIVSDREYQQSYLTVSSAAQLLAKKLDGLRYTVTTKNGVAAEITPEFFGEDAEFLAVMSALADEVTNSGTDCNANLTFSFAGMDTVTAELVMKANYSVSVLLKLDGQSQSFRLALDLDGSKNVTAYTVDSEEIITTTISWWNPRIRKQ